LRRELGAERRAARPGGKAGVRRGYRIGGGDV
jgi:hypothetical protein